MARMRELKRQVLGLLPGLSSEDRLAPILALDPRAAAGPLFSLLLHPDPLTRWRAVAALGAVAARLADTRLEDGRTIVRRYMWHMNEESGNMGWGIPEAMGETLARHPGLAAEYHRILCSWAHDFAGVADSTWIEHPPLRAGAYWGIARLAQARPDLARRAVPDLAAALALGPEPDDPLRRETDQGRAHAILALAALQAPEAQDALAPLADSETPITVYQDFHLHPTTLGHLARKALEGG